RGVARLPYVTLPSLLRGYVSKDHYVALVLLCSFSSLRLCGLSTRRSLSVGRPAAYSHKLFACLNDILHAPFLFSQIFVNLLFMVCPACGTSPVNTTSSLPMVMARSFRIVMCSMSRVKDVNRMVPLFIITNNS